MTPLKKLEAETFGHYKASAKVPLVVVSNAGHQDFEPQFQQTDVFNTLQGMVAGKQCRSPWRGVLWGHGMASPDLIAHRRGDNRDKVSIFSQDRDYLVKLDGDDTRFSGATPSDQAVARTILDKINTLRMARVDWAAKYAGMSN